MPSAKKSSSHSASKVRAVGSKASVYKGHAKHTSGGLTKKDILRIVIRRGGKKVGYRYVSKKKHAAGRKLQRGAGKGTRRYLQLWRAACRKVTGGRVPKKGTSEYAKCKQLYRKLLASLPKAARSAKRSHKKRSHRKGAKKSHKKRSHKKSASKSRSRK